MGLLSTRNGSRTTVTARSDTLLAMSIASVVQFEKMTAADVFGLLSALNAFAVTQAVARASEEDIARLRAAAERAAEIVEVESAAASLKHYFVTLSAISHNPLLAALCRSITEIQIGLAVKLSGGSIKDWRRVAGSLHDARMEIVDAIAERDADRASSCGMRDLVRLIVWMVADMFRSRTALEMELCMLRQQINVLRRTAPKKPTFSAIDRLLLVCLYRLLPGVRDALAIVKPETVVKWHRAGFGLYWRWKSKARWQANSSVGDTQAYPRDEHCQSAVGAPRIHGELLKLGVDIGRTSAAKYMVRRRDPPSQGWRTFLRNHADGIAAMDMFVVPTISFRLLYGLLIMGHGRRHILWFGVTAHPTADWIANQITEACGWEQAPRYLIRDRDGAYGEVVIRRLRSIGIRDRPFDH
jgi:DNA-binding FadR family transcriptional regulator